MDSVAVRDGVGRRVAHRGAASSPMTGIRSVYEAVSVCSNDDCNSVNKIRAGTYLWKKLLRRYS
jgi:hypothetical protein